MGQVPLLADVRVGSTPGVPSQPSIRTARPARPSPPSPVDVAHRAERRYSAGLNLIDS
ncbi:MAG: hypothetical protein R2711_15550 [Acidimicrobiales bacterium]